MKPEKEKILFDKFPLLFADIDKPKTVSLMSFGICCKDGWFDLIYKMAEKIENILENMKTENPDEELPRAFQMKEKFGVFLCYMSSSNDAIDSAIEEAEITSAITCEKCGQPGKMRKGSWLRTLCIKCPLYERAENARL